VQDGRAGNWFELQNRLGVGVHTCFILISFVLGLVFSFVCELVLFSAGKFCCGLCGGLHCGESFICFVAFGWGWVVCGVCLCVVVELYL